MSIATATKEKGKEKTWTYKKYLKLDDGKRYEILEGELIMLGAPTSYHQRTSRDLEFLLWQYVKERDLGEVYFAPIDVVLDKNNVVQPDLLFILKENADIIKDKIFGSPDVVIEIISKWSVQRDRRRKFNIYEKFKIKEYWIVDIAYKTIEVYILEDGKYKELCKAEKSGQVKSKIIEGFEVNVGDVIK